MLTAKDYGLALRLQDVSNFYALVRVLCSSITTVEETLKHLHMDVQQAHRHPIIVLVASKLYSMLEESWDIARGQERYETTWQLKVYARCLHTAVDNIKRGATDAGFTVDEVFLREQYAVKWLTTSIAALTDCEDVDRFGIAYEACRVAAAGEANLNEDWLHQVIGPFKES